MFLPEISRAGTEDISRDYKTKLQEEVQTRFKEAPEYRLVSESGPDHAKIFEIHLYIKGEKISSGAGKSKKQAEQSAAQAALNAIFALDATAANDA
jgi:ribonuclease-3